MKKRSKLLALSAVVAASGIVAAVPNPMQAEASSNAEVLVKKAEQLANALKWEVSYESRLDKYPDQVVGYPDMKLFNETKKALNDAAAAVKQLKGKDKEVMQARLSGNVQVYFERAIKYIDAITAGKKIQEKADVLNKQLQANIINDSTETAYHELSKAIKRYSPVIWKTYGKTTRDQIIEAYQQYGYAKKQEALYPVTLKIEIDRLNTAIKNNDTDKVKYHQERVEKFLEEAISKGNLTEDSKIYQTIKQSYTESKNEIGKKPESGDNGTTTPNPGPTTPDSITPTKFNDLKIILSWGNTISDLDAHLIGPASDGQTFHTWYSDKVYEADGTKYVQLDKDSQVLEGSETTTMQKPVAGTYKFYVNSFSIEDELKNSDAVVKIYFDDSLTPWKTFAIPKDAGEERYWLAFELDINTDGNVTNLRTVSKMMDSIPEVTYENLMAEAAYIMDQAELQTAKVPEAARTKLKTAITSAETAYKKNYPLNTVLEKLRTAIDEVRGYF